MNARVFFEHSVREALECAAPLVTQSQVGLARENAGDLPGFFAVSPLASAVIGAASAEAAVCLGARSVHVDHVLASRWFSMTLRPMGWELPSAWDPIAGDYQTPDGWVRLHTNAPHHRNAALQVLGLNDSAARDHVADRVAQMNGSGLEAAILRAGGAAAQMHSREDWRAHQQGQAVAREPLIAWKMHEAGAANTGPELRGLKVLDLTRVLAGPVATRFLAGFGARVLRIDPPNWSEPGVEPEVTMGKRCAGLDLHNATDRAQFEALLRDADVLVHGYRPGALARLGYDAANLRRLNPGLIDVSLNAYGWSGPWAARRGFDSLVQMSCGIAHTGMIKGGHARPFPLPVQALDHATGYLMAAAVLRALRVRSEGGPALSARLSLARTAELLCAAGESDASTRLPEDQPQDLSSGIEDTGWGPAHRLRAPMELGAQELGGQGPHWALAAGPLRRHAPAWVGD